MKKKPIHLMCLLLAGILSLGNEGCPVETPDEFNPPSAPFQAVMETDLFCLIWLVYKRGFEIEPNSTFIEFPSGVSVNGFYSESMSANSKVGYFDYPAFPTDSSASGQPLGKPAGTSAVPIRLTTQFPRLSTAGQRTTGISPGDAAYIDFNNNSVFDGGLEPFIQIDRFTNSFFIENPFGGTLAAAGRYGSTFFGDVLDFDNSLDQFAFEFRVQQFFDDPAGMNSAELDGVLLHLENASVLPHLPLGNFQAPAGGSATLQALTTQIVINNPHPVPVDGRLIFRDTVTGELTGVEIGRIDGGQVPLSAQTPAVVVESLDFTLAAYEGATFQLGFLDPVRTTWAFIVGTEELSAAANFVTFTPGTGPLAALPGPSGTNIVAEAGIASSNVANVHVLTVSSTADGIDTALAIVNPSSSEARLELTLKASPQSAPLGSSQPPGTVATGELTLDPYTQRALFFNQLFGLEAAPFQGVVEIRSNVSIAVTSLKTINGLQSSSLPAGN